MKKKITLIIISMLALFLMAGCSSDDSGTKEGSGTETTVSAAAEDNETTEVQTDTPVDGKQDVIGDTKAKGIALARVTGAKESDITEFKLETDDGKQKYEGEIRYKGKEYDFDIDAVTGKVLDWEEEAIKD